MRTAVVWPLLLVVTLVVSQYPEILDDWYYDPGVLTVRYRKLQIGDTSWMPNVLLPNQNSYEHFFCLIPIPTGNSDSILGKAAEASERIFGGHSVNSVVNPYLLCCGQVFWYREEYIEVEVKFIEYQKRKDKSGYLQAYKPDKLKPSHDCSPLTIDEWYQEHTRQEYIDKFRDALCGFKAFWRVNSQYLSIRIDLNSYLVSNVQEICDTPLPTKSTKKTITSTTARTTTTSSTTTTSTTTTTTSTTTTTAITTATTSTVETTSSTSTQWWNVITQQSSTQNIVEDDDAEFASGMEASADNSGQVSSESVVAVLILWLAAFGNN